MPCFKLPPPSNACLQVPFSPSRDGTEFTDLSKKHLLVGEYKLFKIEHRASSTYFARPGRAARSVLAEVFQIDLICINAAGKEESSF
jgi:hypothetical protein